jgi:hypothetical protein
MEYENRIKRLESLLQERDDAQPQVYDQPLQAADPSIPAAEWVMNLRNELPSIPRPDVPDFGALYGQVFLHDHGLIPAIDPGAGFQFSIEEDSTQSAESLVASMTINDLEPSAEFQQDAALLQSTDFALDPVIDDFPPPLPQDSSCDW